MPLFKRIPVLCVPRIVECPHEFKIVVCHVILPKYELGQVAYAGASHQRGFHSIPDWHNNLTDPLFGQSTQAD